MAAEQPEGIVFVAGTDTGVGKTIVTAALVRRLRALGRQAIGIKPVETGCSHDDTHDLIGSDGQLLHVAAHRGAPPLVVSPYRFAPPVSPALAAERAGIELSLDDLATAVEATFSFGRVVVVESAGGALSPIAQDGLGLDLAERLGAAVLVVGADQLGVQSQALLVLEAIRRRALRIAGVILSRLVPQSPEIDIQDNVRMIRERGGVQVFPTIPWLEGEDKARLLAAESHLTAHAIAEAILDAALRP